MKTKSKSTNGLTHKAGPIVPFDLAYKNLAQIELPNSLHLVKFNSFKEFIFSTI